MNMYLPADSRAEGFQSMRKGIDADVDAGAISNPDPGRKCPISPDIPSPPNFDKRLRFSATPSQSTPRSGHSSDALPAKPADHEVSFTVGGSWLQIAW